MSTNSILLIWQEVPENIRLFVFPEDHPDKEAILACHNKLINYTDLPESDPIFTINDRLADENGVNHYAQNEIYNGEQSSPIPHIRGTITVVVSGFHL